MGTLFSIYFIQIDLFFLLGLDFAYVKNGYVYHTKYDVPEAITVGAIQQAGKEKHLYKLHSWNCVYECISYYATYFILKVS